MLQLCCLVLAGLLRASAGAIPSNAGLKPRPWESVDGGAWGYFQLAPRKPKGTVVSSRCRCRRSPLACRPAGVV